MSTRYRWRVLVTIPSGGVDQQRQLKFDKASTDISSAGVLIVRVQHGEGFYDDRIVFAAPPGHWIECSEWPMDGGRE